MGVAGFLLVGEGWNLSIFLHSLLKCVMLEGLVMALVGSLSFFGFEKYRKLTAGEVTNNGRRQEKSKPRAHKLNLGLFLIALGISLFFVAFSCFSLIF